MSITTEKPESKALSVYLNDHLAAEAIGLNHVKRAALKHKGTRLGTFLELLSWELEEDQESLVRLMAELGIRRRRAGVVLAEVADLAGHLKHSGHTPLEELESLHLSVDGKLDMWNALRSSVGDRLNNIDIDELAHRAELQAEQLKRRRLAVAAGALSGLQTREFDGRDVEASRRTM